MSNPTSPTDRAARERSQKNRRSQAGDITTFTYDPAQPPVIHLIFIGSNGLTSHSSNTILGLENNITRCCHYVSTDVRFVKVDGDIGNVMNPRQIYEHVMRRSVLTGGPERTFNFKEWVMIQAEGRERTKERVEVNERKMAEMGKGGLMRRLSRSWGKGKET